MNSGANDTCTDIPNSTTANSTEQTKDIYTATGQACNTMLPLQSHRGRPSTALIAVTVLAVVLFALLTTACIRLYKKRAYDKERVIGFPAGTFLYHDLTPISNWASESARPTNLARS